MTNPAKKTTLNALGVKALDLGTVELQYNDTVIYVDTYIPTQDKFAIINDTLALSFVNGIFNPVAVEAVFHALLFQSVTSIKYSKGQQESLITTYDLINASGLLKIVCDTLGEAYDEIVEDLMAILEKNEQKQKTVIEQVVDAVTAFSGVLQDVNNLDENSLDMIAKVMTNMQPPVKQ